VYEQIHVTWMADVTNVRTMYSDSEVNKHVNSCRNVCSKEPPPDKVCSAFTVNSSQLAQYTGTWANHSCNVQT